MKKAILELVKDIQHRWIRALCVALLTTAVLVSFFITSEAWNPWISIARVLCIAAIIGIISTDTTRELHHSKAALYVTVMLASAWVTAFVDTLRHPPTTLLSLSTGGDTVFLIEATPIVFISILVVVYAVSGAIAYKIGHKRGDIRGTKKQHLFK